MTDDSPELLKANAFIRFFHKVDPERLDDEEWAKRYNEIMYILDIFKKMITIEE